MRKIWKEFKSFALGGSMLDLALGFIIGTAFATVVTSATDNLLTPLVGAIFDTNNLSKDFWKVRGTTLNYGQFLQACINFVLFAFILYFILKMIGTLGIGRTRVFEERQCPYCMEFVNPEALVCRTCRNSLVATLPDLAAAQERAAKLRARHHLKIDLPDIDLPDLKDLPIPHRRHGAEADPALRVVPAVAAVVEVKPPDEED
jgi:large conductance mechanosensitive channel